MLEFTSQDNKAAVSATLGLLRHVGSIIGIATNSCGFQNSIDTFLDRVVNDYCRVRIVMAIATLDPNHKGQIIYAYAQALKLMVRMSLEYLHL